MSSNDWISANRSRAIGFRESVSGVVLFLLDQVGGVFGLVGVDAVFGTSAGALDGVTLILTGN